VQQCTLFGHGLLYSKNLLLHAVLKSGSVSQSAAGGYQLGSPAILDILVICIFFDFIELIKFLTLLISF
jgi:hypothetical protein